MSIFFLHHAFPSLYNINFMVCLIMSACSSVIIEYFEANLYGWIEITYVKANHFVVFLFVNVVELAYYIFCIFPRVDACFWFDIENNFLYNLLADSCQFRLTMVYGSAAWFIFKICLAVFEGNMLLSWL